MRKKTRFEYGQKLGNYGATYICDSLSQHKRREIWVVCGVCKKDWLVELYNVTHNRSTSCCYGLVPKRIPQDKLALKSPVHAVWKGMKSRCLNPGRTNYTYYGGRGITVSESWLDFRNFEADMLPSYQKGLQLDRRDNNKGYSVENCRWVTCKVNSRNRRNTVQITYLGISKPSGEWAEELNLSPRVIRSRLRQGKRGEELFRPVPLKAQ